MNASLNSGPDWSHWKWPPDKEEWQRILQREADYQARRAAEREDVGPLERFFMRFFGC